ncbi:MAG: M28 family peptidase [Armatimonadota bacterium]|nr:M28 family peptidase [Armatimonadota bacterium]
MADAPYGQVSARRLMADDAVRSGRRGEGMGDAGKGRRSVTAPRGDQRGRPRKTDEGVVEDEARAAIVSAVRGSPAPDDLSRLPRLPVVTVARAEGDRLREMARAGGLRLRITAQVDTRWRKTPLLTGDLPGAVEDTFVLVSGHLDAWHRGAMDNGTANATMLEVARLMARVRRYRGIRFAFWSGHSHGRYSGSAWYADHFWHDLHTRCAVHINVDSTGGRGSVINRHGCAMPETRRVADRAAA